MDWLPLIVTAAGVVVAVAGVVVAGLGLLYKVLSNQFAALDKRIDRLDDRLDTLLHTVSADTRGVSERVARIEGAIGSGLGSDTDAKPIPLPTRGSGFS